MRKLKTERRPEILDAALAIADERGLDALSMRAVAERIGVTPMALYGYFRNKDELLDGLVGRLLCEIPSPDPAAEGGRRLGVMARGLRQVALRHPGVFPLLLARPASTPDAVRVTGAVFQALTDLGVPDDEVPRMERLASTFVMGFAISEVNGRFSGRTDKELDAEFEADLADLFRIIRPA